MSVSAEVIHILMCDHPHIQLGRTQIGYTHSLSLSLSHTHTRAHTHTHTHARTQELHEIEERKNSHINELMKKHERAFAGVCVGVGVGFC